MIKGIRVVLVSIHVIFINLAEKRVCYTLWYVERTSPSMPLKFLAKKLKLRENIARAGWSREVFLVIIFVTFYSCIGEAFCSWRMC
jgi:hypothetical protein